MYCSNDSDGVSRAVHRKANRIQWKEKVGTGLLGKSLGEEPQVREPAQPPDKCGLGQWLRTESAASPKVKHCSTERETDIRTAGEGGLQKPVSRSLLTLSYTCRQNPSSSTGLFRNIET